MKIFDINFKEVLKNLDYNAYNYGNGKRFIVSGKDVVELKGYIYEPGYESFSATHSIKLNGEILFGKDARSVANYQNETYTFGKFKTESEAIEYLKEYFGNREITIQYDEPTNEQENEEDEEEFY